MNLSDLARNAHMLTGSLARRGYMRWWHSLSGIQPETGEQRTFFVEFFCINPGLGCDQPILGQHPYFKKRGMRPSYVMIKAGVYPNAQGKGGKQLHAFYPVSSLKTTQSPLTMQVEDCLYSESRLSGYIDVSWQEARHRSLMTNAGSMEWDLEVSKMVSCHTGLLAGRFFQALNALDSYWHGEGIRSFFKGTVTLDGTVYQVSPDTSYGYADKHWGRSFNRPWVQLASCRLTSERTGKELRSSVLAVSGCCPRFLFIPLRHKLMIQLTYTGEDYEFGFPRPFLLSRCKWETKETNKRYIWHITARNRNAVIKISGNCVKEQMMPLLYENPDGIKPRNPLLSGGCGTGTVQIFRRTPGGRELLDTLHMENMLCAYRGQRSAD